MDLIASISFNEFHREDVDDPGLLLRGVLAALYHHAQLPGVGLTDLHLDQVRRRPDETGSGLKCRS